MQKVIAWFTAFILALMVTSVAQAQAYIPSTRIGSAELISPGAANTAYGSSTTATNGLGLSERREEIRALARALKNDPDLIYEYVRNTVDIEWYYGLQRGAMGALLDKSGNAFDQAHLMVELLREAGHTASFKAGTITLSAAEFESWSGIEKATAACKLLSSGGIPATVNGSTSASCSYGSADLTSVTLSHIWVSAVIGGSSYVFDPSFKPHTFEAGINLYSAAGLTAGTVYSTATSGMSSGTNSSVDYVRSLNSSGLTTKLQTLGSSLLTYINTNMPSADIDEVVGGSSIDRYDTPSGGLRQVSLPYSSSSVDHSWTGNIPDQYRTSLRVQIYKDDDGTTSPFVEIIDETLYVDEIYGEKLVATPNFPYAANFGGIHDFQLDLNVTNASGGGVNIDTYFLSNDEVNFRQGSIKLTADHPYAASSAGGGTAGDYMDASVEKSVTLMLPFTILNGWGATGVGVSDAWGTRDDVALPNVPNISGCDTCDTIYNGSKGDARREQFAVSWMVQAAQASNLHAEIADSIYTHHHSIGIVAADVSQTITTHGSYGDYYYSISESFDRIDVDTAFSLTSQDDDSVGRRAGVHAIAATLSALEGSVAGQIGDLPDTSSTATRFDWGNAPPSAEDFSASYGPRRFYNYNSGNASAAASLSVVEGLSSATATYYATTEPVVLSAEVATRKNRLSEAIEQYADDGFVVVASEDAFLGPGQRAGTRRDRSYPVGARFHLFSQQRGGALVATKYSGGEPIEIAHIMVGHDENSKGGGGGVQPTNDGDYNPSTAADVLKSRFIDKAEAVGVDLKTGSVTLTGMAALRVGTGGFPYELSAQQIWNGRRQPAKHLFGPDKPSEPQAPWTTNWHNTLSISSSATEAMGATDARAAAGTIAAFLAQQDTYRESPSTAREVAGTLVGAWWVKKIQNNAVTATVGATTTQFIKDVSGNWFSPGTNSYATLLQTGEREISTRSCNMSEGDYALTRGWDERDVSFVIKNANGDEQHFDHWEDEYNIGGNLYDCAYIGGFRLEQWAFPEGVSIDLSYTYPGSSETPHVSAVTNSIGNSIAIDGLEFTNNKTDGDKREIAFGAAGVAGTIEYSITDQEENTRRIRAVGKALGGGYNITAVYDANDTTVPSIEYVYDAADRVAEVRDASMLQESVSGKFEFFLADGYRSERIDPLGRGYVIIRDEDGNPARFIDGDGQETKASYDGRGRLVEYEFPEGDRELLEYDNRNNQTKLTKEAKVGSGLTDIVIEANWETTWNKLAWIDDALDNRTDFTYKSSGNGAGKILTATRQAATSGGTRPVYSFSYGAYGNLASATNPTGTVTSNTYDTAIGKRANLLSATMDPSGLAIVTSNTYDIHGDVITVTDPRGNVTTNSYDKLRRTVVVKGPDPDGAGPFIAPQMAKIFNENGQEVKSCERVENTFVADPLTACAAATHANQTVWAVTATEYDVAGRPKKVTDPDGYNSFTYYDAGGLEIVAVDAAGRKTRTVYDAAGRVVKLIKAWAGNVDGTGSTLDCATMRSNYDPSTGYLQQCYQLYTYTDNGQIETVTDAGGNVTTYEYDGHDRLYRTYFPSKGTPGQSSATDYEQYTYDLNGNMTAKRTRSGDTITFYYDDLNRLTDRYVPDAPSHTANARTVTHDFTYDLVGRRLTATHDGVTLGLSYDAIGRLVSQSHNSVRPVSWAYDAASNLTKLTHPDGYEVDFAYDALNRVAAANDNNGSTGRTLATIAYDSQSRRQSVSYANGTDADYAYSQRGDLTDHDWDYAGTANDAAFDFTYNGVGQLTSRSISDTSLIWAPAVSSTDNYTVNGLNQYATITPSGAPAVSISYDDNGNLTGDVQGRAFIYDAENVLRQVEDGSSTAIAAYGYFADGARAEKTVGSVVSSFYYDADQEIAEYDGATLLRRYLRLPGSIDEPFLMIDYTRSGSCTANDYSDCEVWAHQDRLGSVIAVSDDAGAVMESFTYSPYGVAGGSSSGFPFRFTGQKLDPETGLYYYKARYYDPETGRFLQTDPIGYEDQMNLYAYVANDPVSLIDPTGEKIGDRFDTPEEAGRDAIDDINSRSISENTEYGGRIDREVTTVTDKDGNVVLDKEGNPVTETQYYATDPIQGDGDSVDIPISRTKTVGIYHTHGDYAKKGPGGAPVRTTRGNDEYDSDNFSSGDRTQARRGARATREARRTGKERFRSYLGTPSGRTKVYTPPR